MIGESVDSALGELGGIPESGSDASDAIEGMFASITAADDSGERGGPGAAPSDPRTRETQRMDPFTESVTCWFRQSPN